MLHIFHKEAQVNFKRVFVHFKNKVHTIKCVKQRYNLGESVQKVRISVQSETTCD